MLHRIAHIRTNALQRCTCKCIFNLTLPKVEIQGGGGGGIYVKRDIFQSSNTYIIVWFVFFHKIILKIQTISY